MKRVTLTAKGRAVLAAAVVGLFKMFSSEFPAFLQGIVDGWKNIEDVSLRNDVFYKYGRGLGARFRKGEARSVTAVADHPNVRRVSPYWTVRQAGMVHAILKRHIEREYGEDSMKPKGAVESINAIANELDRAIGASQT